MKKTKNILFFISFIILFHDGFSQSIKFRKVIGNNGYDVGMSAQQTLDKGYIAFGSTSSFGGGASDFYLIKTDSLGVPLWHRMYGSINVDKGTCVRQTTDKGYIMAGYTNSYGAGGYDVYLVKTDSFGAVQWAKTYGGSDWEFANCVEQTSDGGYIICGGTYSYGNGDEDFYLIKTDILGDTLWTKTYGGANEEEAKSVVETSDGGYILTGHTKSMGDTNGDFYTVKTNSIGDTLWTNVFGGPLLDYAKDVLENSYGGYTVGGETKNYGGGNSDGILIYINAAGVTDPFVFTSGGADHETFESVAEGSDGKLFLIGSTFTWGFVNGKGDINIFVLNSDWSYNNSTTFGTPETESVNSIERTSDKGSIICGTTNGYNNKLDDFYLIKTDSTCFSTTSETVFITNIQDLGTQDVFNFSISPNPSNVGTYLNISSKSEKINVSVYNVIGELLSKEEFRNTSTNLLSIPINTSDLPTGVYLLKIETDQAVHTERVVVRH